MLKQYARSDRVADVLQKEICEMLHKEVKDPHLGFITITGVEVSRDLKLAKLYYTILGPPDRVEDSTRALRRITPFLKRGLGRKLHLRATPDIVFIYDHSLEYGTKIDHILDSLRESSDPTALEE
jgi:ribosome-binding factor A